LGIPSFGRVGTFGGWYKFRVDRIFSGAGHVQQDKSTHDADVLVEIDHILVMVSPRHCPIWMTDKRGRDCVEREQDGQRAREDTDDDRDRDEDLYDDRHRGG
jgi:hypothetical protein